MSITVQIDDPVLSRMLYLEAKRHGFEKSSSAILLLDPTFGTVPQSASDSLIIGITAHPEAVSEATRRSLFALLSLPFSAKELEKVIRCFREGHDLRIERADDLLYLNGQKISLSHTEAKLFDLLFENRHRPVSEKEMTDLLGESATHTNTLAVYLHRLRRKLGEAGRCIKTLRGKGCQWIEWR